MNLVFKLVAYSHIHCNVCIDSLAIVLLKTTVEPLYNGHHWDQ